MEPPNPPMEDSASGAALSGRRIPSSPISGSARSPDRRRRSLLAQAEARRPLSKAHLDDLLDHVEDRLRVEPCDHSLRHSKGFLRALEVNVGAVAAWLRRSGGYCDCEVLMNVGDEWRDPP